MKWSHESGPCPDMVADNGWRLRSIGPHGRWYLVRPSGHFYRSPAGRRVSFKSIEAAKARVEEVSA